MRKATLSLLAGAALAVAATTASARPHIDVGISFGIPAPVYVAPPPVYYAPPPVYVAPRPVYYAPPPVYYAPAPVYYGPPVHRHRHWRHHGHHHRW